MSALLALLALVSLGLAPSTVTPPPPTAEPAVIVTVTVMLRAPTGAGILGARVYGLQDQRRAGECVTDASGGCLLTLELRRPVMFEPELRIEGYPLSSVTVAHDGLFLLPRRLFGTTIGFVAHLPQADGIVEDANPTGAPLPVLPVPAPTALAALRTPLAPLPTRAESLRTAVPVATGVPAAPAATQGARAQATATALSAGRAQAAAGTGDGTARANLELVVVVLIGALLMALVLRGRAAGGR